MIFELNRHAISGFGLLQVPRIRYSEVLKRQYTTTFGSSSGMSSRSLVSIWSSDFKQLLSPFLYTSVRVNRVRTGRPSAFRRAVIGECRSESIWTLLQFAFGMTQCAILFEPHTNDITLTLHNQVRQIRASQIYSSLLLVIARDTSLSVVTWRRIKASCDEQSFGAAVRSPTSACHAVQALTASRGRQPDEDSLSCEMLRSDHLLRRTMMV